MDIKQIMDVADVMIRSGYFSDLSPDQIAVRILAGQELGVSAVAAVKGVDFIRGQLSFKSHLMAAMLKKTGRYSYIVKENTAEKCIIEFFENDKPLGLSEFTWQDANTAGLTGNQQYKKWPKVMLYNRAMSQGARMFCPDVFAGAAYEPGEIESTEDEPQGTKDIPDTSGTPEPKGEPASEKQMGMLYGLLKQSGVHDGHKSKLVERIFPGGITKREASVAISLLKDVGRLWDVWAEQYIRLLAEENSTSTKEVATWMREKFGTLAVNDISSEQLRTLLAWITGDMEDIPEPVYTPGEPVHEPSAGDWAQLVAGICQGAGVSLDDLSAWAIESYSTVPGIDDMAMLGSSVYDKLRSASSDLDWIKEQVTEFSTQKPLL